MTKFVVSVILLVLLVALPEIHGHGMLLDPAGRSSRWRYNSSAPKNYNDNGLYCGGFGTQWYTHGGNCGLCGDDYGLATPRPNEIGGTYGGTGVIVKTYVDTNTVKVGFQITANHLGFVYFNLCDLDEFGSESEDCFNKYRLQFGDNTDKYFFGTSTGYFETTILLPENLRCEHCVLRWTYNAGNNWGICENGSGALGCGNQENFKSCADISIKSATGQEVVELPSEVTEEHA